MPLVALFGAAGFAGRAILDALLDAGYRVRALDLTKSSWTQVRTAALDRDRTPVHPLAVAVLNFVMVILPIAPLSRICSLAAPQLHTTVSSAPDTGRPGSDSPEKTADATACQHQGFWNVLGSV